MSWVGHGSRAGRLDRDQLGRSAQDPAAVGNGSGSAVSRHSTEWPRHGRSAARPKEAMAQGTLPRFWPGTCVMWLSSKGGRDLPLDDDDGGRARGCVLTSTTPRRLLHLHLRELVPQTCPGHASAQTCGCVRVSLGRGPQGKQGRPTPRGVPLGYDARWDGDAVGGSPGGGVLFARMHTSEAAVPEPGSPSPAPLASRKRPRIPREGPRPQAHVRVALWLLCEVPPGQAGTALPGGWPPRGRVRADFSL